MAFFYFKRVDSAIRNPQAVRIALRDHWIFGDVDATLGSINHHSAAPIRSLRNIGGSIWGPDCSKKSNRLVLCLMELGMMADILQWLASLPDGPLGLAARTATFGSYRAGRSNSNVADPEGGPADGAPQGEPGATAEGDVACRAKTPFLSSYAPTATTQLR